MTGHPARQEAPPDIPPPDLDGIDPDQPHVEFCAFQCRGCGEVGPWVSMGDREDPRHAWTSTHYDAYGRAPEHQRFYRWSVARSLAGTFAL